MFNFISYSTCHVVKLSKTWEDLIIKHIRNDKKFPIKDIDLNVLSKCIIIITYVKCNVPVPILTSEFRRLVQGSDYVWPPTLHAKPYRSLEDMYSQEVMTTSDFCTGEGVIAGQYRARGAELYKSPARRSVPIS